MSLEDRVIECETRIAYQDETLRVLNEVVTRQAMLVEQLQAVCRQLSERLARSGDGEGAVKGTLADEVPPHY